MVSGRQSPDVLLNFLRCSGQPLAVQGGLAQNVSSAEDGKRHARG